MTDFRLQDDSAGDRQVEQWRQDLEVQNDPVLRADQAEMDEFRRSIDKLHTFPDIVMPAIIYAGLAVQAVNEGTEQPLGDEHIRDRKESTRFVLFGAERIDEVADMIAGALAKKGTGKTTDLAGMHSDFLTYFSHLLDGMKRGMEAVKTNQHARGL